MGCHSAVVSGNTINNAEAGLFDVPPGFDQVNTFTSVDGSCAGSN